MNYRLSPHEIALHQARANAANPNAYPNMVFQGQNAAQYFSFVPNLNAGATAPNASAVMSQSVVTQQFANLGAQQHQAPANGQSPQYVLYSVQPGMANPTGASVSGAPTATPLSFTTAPTVVNSQAYGGYTFIQPSISSPMSQQNVQLAQQQFAQASANVACAQDYSVHRVNFRPPMQTVQVLSNPLLQQQQVAALPPGVPLGKPEAPSGTEIQPPPAPQPVLSAEELHLELPGELGLAPLLECMNHAQPMWPAYTEVPGGKKGLRSTGEFAARRLLPENAGEGAPPLSSISSLLVYGFDQDSFNLPLNETYPISSGLSSLPLDYLERNITPDYVAKEAHRKAKPQMLTMSLYNSFPDCTLFYIFYSMPGDVLHLAAARCLYDRKWLYDRRHRFWCRIAGKSHTGNAEPSSNASLTPNSTASSTIGETGQQMGGMSGETLVFDYFDVSTWSIRRYSRPIDLKDMEQAARIKECMVKAADNSGKKPTIIANPQAAAAGAAVPPPTPPYEEPKHNPESDK